MKTSRKRRPQFLSPKLECLEERRVLALGIDVGYHELLPDTPGQWIDIIVRSDEDDLEVTDFLLRAQIGDGAEGRPTPVFQCSEPGCVGPPQPTTAVPWFVGKGQIWDSVSTTVVGGPLFANPPDVPADYQNVAQATVTIDAAGATTRADGLLVRLEIDTTGIAAGNIYELRLADTIIGVNSHFLTTGPVRIDPQITNGAIGIVENTSLRVRSVELNGDQADPPDRPVGPQPSSWQEQRSDLRSITVTFNDEVEVRPEDLVLVNLGVDAPADADREVALDPDQLSVNGRELVIDFPPDTALDLADGAYRLEILPTITSPRGLELDGDGDGATGDAYVVQGDDVNGLYQLTADLNGDRGVSIFDFPAFAYWFGVSPSEGPQYVDFNLDGGITIFDFPIFAANFQSAVVLPTAFDLAASAISSQNASASGEVRRLIQAAPQEKATAIDLIWRQAWRMPLTRPASPTNRADPEVASVALRSLDELLEAIAAVAWLPHSPKNPD